MKEAPLISVIIPCYNHGKYIPTAVNSILEQDYKNTEIILVDDGSTDDTTQQAAKFPSVKYIYQANQGLSAARNTGITASKGEFLLFLDTDDWLTKDALTKNFESLKAAPGAAFVSGGHIKISDKGKIIEEVATKVENDHYLNLLQGNYIGMHATVLYRRWIFDHFKYDTALRACEDYDLYLNIARKFPVIHHTHIIAYYLIHDSNMSGNRKMMLETVLKVLERQRKNVETDEERAALENGRNIWTEYYTQNKRNKKKRYRMIKRIKKYTPDFVKRILNKAGILKQYTPKPGNIQWGDFKRVTPFSIEFGYDRGGPVDRYYIEAFLDKHSSDVHGLILEIGDNDYTLKYGGKKITKSDILHIDEKNEKATIIGDLSNIPEIPDNSYDCIILTQTLHLIYDFNAALKTCYRILKPGGTLLMTVPGITHIAQDLWGSNWLWAFTGSSIIRMLTNVFPESGVTVETHGNVHIASAFLYGVGVNEVEKKYFNYNDPHYQVIIAASAVKPS